MRKEIVGVAIDDAAFIAPGRTSKLLVAQMVKAFIERLARNGNFIEKLVLNWILGKVNEYIKEGLDEGWTI